ncbi:MAG: thioester domain-containing protein, partial [Desulfobacteraceae bacterium]|nr:thioester domain-containing protein [Desulfobacteraceae bacterium]
MKFAMLVALAAILCVGVFTGACRASTIHVESYPGLSGIGVTGYNGSAGEFQVGVNSVAIDAAAYCVDFSKTITVPGTYGNYTLEAASSQSTIYQVGAWILSQYAPGLGQTAWYSGVAGATTAIAQAAVQLAIWEVTQETSSSALYNLLTGTFQVTLDSSSGIATTLANNILLSAYNTLYSGSEKAYVVS